MGGAFNALPCGALEMALREAVAGVGLDDAAGADQVGESVAQGLGAHAAGAAEVVEGDRDGKLGERGQDAIGGGRDGIGGGRAGVGRERRIGREGERDAAGDQLDGERTMRRFGAVLDGEESALAVAAEVEVRVAPRVEFERAAQGLAGAGAATPLRAWWTRTTATLEAALELAEVGEQRRDLGGRRSRRCGAGGRKGRGRGGAGAARRRSSASAPAIGARASRRTVGRGDDVDVERRRARRPRRRDAVEAMRARRAAHPRRRRAARGRAARPRSGADTARRRRPRRPCRARETTCSTSARRRRCRRPASAHSPSMSQRRASGGRGSRSAGASDVAAGRRSSPACCRPGARGGAGWAARRRCRQASRGRASRRVRLALALRGRQRAASMRQCS